MTGPVEGLVVETHAYPTAVSFWTDLGYQIEFAADHGSAQLRHPAGGHGSS